jgi:inner membrane protein
LDSFTHIAIGACVGEAFFERGFGKKALFWGVLAQSIPDIDFISSLWLTTPEALLAHRGFTHSIFFAFIIIPVFALAADKIHHPHNIAFRKWIYFFSAEVFIHLFLDGFNNYGVGWFEPFSHYRFSFNAIYVADPFFSVWPGIALILLVYLSAYHPKRIFWWKFGLFIPLFYLTACTINKISVNNEVKRKMNLLDISSNRFFTTPTPFQNLLWYVVVENDKGFDIAYYSVFDTSDKLHFIFHSKNEYLLNKIQDHEGLQKLKRFSNDFYTIEQYHDTIVYNDIRFGQIEGWSKPMGQFVFHYYLNHPKDNTLVVQRGRFAGWNKKVLFSFFKRISGD